MPDEKALGERPGARGCKSPTDRVTPGSSRVAGRCVTESPWLLTGLRVPPHRGKPGSTPGTPRCKECEPLAARGARALCKGVQGPL